MPTVFVPPSNRRGRDEKYYHTDPDCGYLKRAGGVEKPLNVLGGNWEYCLRCAARSTAGRRAIRDVVEADSRVELVVSATGSKGHIRADGEVLCYAGNSQRTFTDVDDLPMGSVCGNCARDAFQAGLVDTPDVNEKPLVADGGEDCGRATPQSVSIDLDDVPTGRRSFHVALVSGGMDSTVAAAVSQEVAPTIDVLAYLDTGTGLDANREYIEDLADALGAQLWTLRTHESYAEKVRENGYPGPSRHGMMYNFLKERQLGKLAKGRDNLVLWTGVRSHESERRMAHVEGVQEADRWTWVAPIHDWTKQDCRAFLDERDLPENPLWDTLGRSGDCFCGCFGSREELIDLEAEGYEDHAEWLRNLDTETDDETTLWAWASLSEHQQRAARVDEDQMTLCSTCAVPDGGEPTDGE